MSHSECRSRALSEAFSVLALLFSLPLALAVPETNRVEDDAAVWTALEGQSRAGLVFFVDDGDGFVFVRPAETVDADGDLPLPVFNDHINPVTELQTRFRL